MTVRELYAELEKKIPKSLSCVWDNDGLLCCPDGRRETKKILIALDVTNEVAEHAIKNGYDCIISHHPFIFKGLKALDCDGDLSAKALRLICNGISVMSFHTRLDAAQGGVNDKLCELFGLGDVSTFDDEGIPLGRVGELDTEMSAEDFARLVKNALHAPFVLLCDAGVPVKRVAVLGGSGKDLIDAARATGADAFVSGRLDYHPMTDGVECKSAPMNLIEAGHFYTEQPVCDVLADMVGDICPDIICDVYVSNVIKAI